MAGTFTVCILTPEKQLCDTAASSIVVPAEHGYMGILSHHAPIVARVRPGTITIKDAAGRDTVLTTHCDGFLSFSGNTATILLEE